MTQNERISLPLWKKLILFLISFIVFVIQLVLFVLLFIFNANYNEGFQAIGYINIVVETIALLYVLWIMHKPISTNYKLTWSILILIMPIPFIVLYTINYISLNLSKRKLTKILNEMPKRKYDDNIDELKLIDQTAYNFVTVVHQYIKILNLHILVMFMKSM